MSPRSRIVLVLLTLVFCMGMDQVTKRYAASHLPKKRALSFAKDTVRLDYAENKGGVFSFEFLLPEEWQGQKVTLATSVFLGLVVFFLLFTPARRPFPFISLSAFCAGGLSNLFDRAVLGGNVIDFLNLGWGGYRTGIFNVADIWITAGASSFALSALLPVFSSFFRRKDRA